MPPSTAGCAIHYGDSILLRDVGEKSTGFVCGNGVTSNAVHMLEPTDLDLTSGAVAPDVQTANTVYIPDLRDVFFR